MDKIPVNKKVIFINQSSGYLMVDIINAYSKAGYTCSLITGLLVERSNPLDNRVRVHNIVRYNNTSALKRVFTWGYGTLQAIILILTHYRQSHLFIVSNPPSAPLIPLILGNSFSLLIFDIYPDAITEFGILKERSLIIRLWKKANRKVYKRALMIFTITGGMKNILKQYSGKKKIAVIPLWSDDKLLKRIANDENPFLSKYNLHGKFVVLYSGNIGISNDVEVLVDVAKRINSPEIVFIIIGSGARKKLIVDRIKQEGVGNIIILPWQEVSQIPYTLSSANLAIVTLGKGASRLAIPSKLFSLLTLGTPIMGIAGQDSDLWNLIETNGIGMNFTPENIEGMAEFILKLSGDPVQWKLMAIKALKLSKQFSSINVSGFIN